jgi:hypothetical protein
MHVTYLISQATYLDANGEPLSRLRSTVVEHLMGFLTLMANGCHYRRSGVDDRRKTRRSHDDE